jgi:hypothetical protein
MNKRELNKKLKKVWKDHSQEIVDRELTAIITGFNIKRKRGRPRKSIKTYKTSFDLWKGKK